ncbi:transposable element Tc1 transposase [Trichonephila clavipes]|nr:transposable element Tc1 transposase [Trichonephila clavipes]
MEKFQQLTKFEPGRIVGLREGEFSYRSIGARVQRISSKVMRVSKQWTDEHRTNSENLAVDDRRQLEARWSTATGVLLTGSSIRRRLLHRGLRARVSLYRIPLTANHRRLRLQWAHEH